MKKTRTSFLMADHSDDLDQLLDSKRKNPFLVFIYPNEYGHDQNSSQLIVFMLSKQLSGALDDFQSLNLASSAQRYNLSLTRRMQFIIIIIIW